jgi:tetratricopeptide (TPR) repeat protein
MQDRRWIMLISGFRRIFALLLLTASFAAWAQQNPPVTREWQEWADINRNGMLEPNEMEQLINAALRLLERPHDNGTPLDRIFDADHDGGVNTQEIEAARNVLIKEQLFRAQEIARDIMPLIDLNSDGKMDDMEVNSIVENLFLNEDTRSPHPVRTPFDRKMDLNGDGRIVPDEFITYRNRIVGTAIFMPPGDMRMAAQEQMTGDQPQKSAAGDQGAASSAQTAAATGAKVVLSDVKISDIFPVFRSFYDDHPIGTATLKNGESAAIGDVKVELEMKGYMDAKKPCTAPAKLAAGEEGKVDLTAVFNDNVLKITEGTKALATVSVTFTINGKSVTNDSVQTVQFLRINAMTWDDDQRAAAFVTANDPAVQQVRSGVVTNVDKASTAIDLKLRTAMALYQALVKYGIKYWTDPNAAYATTSASDTAVDSLQFPIQTLQLKTGDCDDLSILVAAILESASVETAFVTVPGHIFIAFALSMTQEQARSAFQNPSNLIYKNDKAWIPWEITSLSGGFLKAWDAGVKEWQAADTKSQAAFYPIHDAWKKYKPVAYSATAASITLPPESDWVKLYTDEVKSFINREIATRVAGIQAEIKKTQNNSESINKLGVLYAKYGLHTEAQAQFALLDSKDYAPALVNLGNIYFLQENWDKALSYYQRAVKKDASNALALLGVARASHEKQNYGDVQTAYKALKTVNAALASRYSYLELTGSEATRAASVAQVQGVVDWSEGGGK